MKNEDRIGVVRQSALATVVALEPISGVSVCAAVFPGYNADVEILSRFDQPVRRTASRYESVAASGGTPLLPALFWAVDASLGRHEPRKMLFVVTDGQPFEPEACREAIRRCWIGRHRGVRARDQGAGYRGSLPGLAFHRRGRRSRRGDVRDVAGSSERSCTELSAKKRNPWRAIAGGFLCLNREPAPDWSYLGIERLGTTQDR